MTLNLDIKKILFVFCIYVFSLIVAFIIGRNIKIKTLEESYSKLEQDLKETQSKMNDVEIRNEELLQINENQKKICDELQNENEDMKSDLNSIKSITISTEQKLNELEIDTNNVSEIIKNLRNNQQIFRIYIQTVSDITKE